MLQADDNHARTVYRDEHHKINRVAYTLVLPIESHNIATIIARVLVKIMLEVQFCSVSQVIWVVYVHNTSTS